MSKQKEHRYEKDILSGARFLAAAAGIVIGVGALGAVRATAPAAKGPPVKPTATAVAPAAPVELNMRQFNQRIAALPELVNAKNGDLVILRDDGGITGSIWRGTYVYRPAGSKVGRVGMYARWRDGVVTLTRTPNPRAGQPALDTLTATYAKNERPPAHIVQPLVRDGADTSVWRIPATPS